MSKFTVISGYTGEEGMQFEAYDMESAAALEHSDYVGYKVRTAV